jgi:hypothetical protein
MLERSVEPAGAADGVGARTLSRYSPERPLLLLTDYPPGAGGGGAVILRSLLGGRDRESVLWLSLTPDAPGRAADGPARVLRSASARYASLLGRRSQTADSLLAASVAAEVRAIAGEARASAIWAVMHGAVVHVAAHLGGPGDLPLHVTVHDDPAFGVALMSRRYFALVPFIERDFSRTLRRARSLDVIGADMADRYRRRYGVTANVVHRGMSPFAAPTAPSAADALEVGVLGNTYGYDQLSLLVEAVANAARGAGVPGRIVVIGQGHGARLREEAAGKIEVEVTGHLDERAAVERLSRCFMLYLNYPFSRRGAVLRQTSFPTKLSTYIQAARPLLVHAPRDSSIRFLASDEFEKLATWWDSTNAAAGAATLERAWRTPSAHESQHGLAELVRRRYYDLESNRRSLFTALDALVT